MTDFPNGSEAPMRYSDRKAQAYGGETPWTIEDLVEAQRMDCAGVPRGEIAEALGRSLTEVNQKLDPQPAPFRGDRAGVGFADMKRR